MCSCPLNNALPDAVRLKLTLAYTGTAYAGWQIQAEGLGRTTIQEELEAALASLIGRRVRVHAAGRTDAGVHAEGQVAHVDVPPRTDMDWQRALNAKLPADIRVAACRAVPAGFHARHSATGKLYAYTLFTGAGNTPPRLEPYAWATPPLDLDAMRETAALLAGRHDFASFQNAGTPVADTVRTLWSVTPERGVAGPFRCPEDWPVTTWFFHGEGFLKQMVRNLMGLLVWVGRGKTAPEQAAAMLAAKDRRAVPSPTAPAKGLTLMYVIYNSLYI